MATESTDPAPDKKDLTPEDHALNFLIDNLGRPGYEPETIVFLIDHPEYEHRPVKIREFIESPQYLDAKGRLWPSVVDELERIFDADPLTNRLSSFREVVLEMGIGSGKSYRVSVAFAYAVYRLLCYKCPQDHFPDMAPDSTIAVMNMSLSEKQAKRTVFGETMAIIAASPWFKSHGRPDPNVKSELRFPKNVVIFPGSSSETAPLGYNIFFCNMDEASFYTDNDQKDLGSLIYDAMYGRVTSRFGECGMVWATSSPRYVDDFTEKKVEESKTNPVIYARVCPTWDNKPADIKAVNEGRCFELAHPRTSSEGARIVKIPTRYEDAFKRNPQKAWRDFGAVASLALDPYFSDDEMIRLDAACRLGYRSKDLSDVPCDPNAEYVVHIDLGLRRDASGFCLARAKAGGGAVIESLLRIVSAVRAAELDKSMVPYDLVIGHEQVSIEALRQMIYSLSARGFFIRRVSMDGFQSADSLQQLEARGYEAVLISIDRDMKAADTMKDFLNTGRLESCRHDFFLLECRRLELVKGKKVDHPPGGSKDLFDGASGACRSIAEMMGEEAEEEFTVVDESYRVDVTPEI